MFEMMENKDIRGKDINDNYVCQKRIITGSTLEYFRKMLIMAEKEMQTIDKYVRDIKKLMTYAKGQSISKEILLKYKDYLQKCGKYKISSINS